MRDPSTRSLVYTLPCCQLQVTGAASGQQEEPTITAFSSFKLLVVDPKFGVRRLFLNGDRKRLEALVSTVLPYSRYLVSGQPRRFGDDKAPIAILPWDKGHRLRIQSDAAGAQPVELQLDDTELADVVYCLDRCLHDPRVSLEIAVPPMRGLRKRELLNRQPWWQRVAAPLGGLSTVAVLLGLATVVPIPERFLQDEEQPVTEEVEPAAVVESREFEITPDGAQELEITPEFEVTAEPAEQENGVVQPPPVLLEPPVAEEQPAAAPP